MGSLAKSMQAKANIRQVSTIGATASAQEARFCKSARLGYMKMTSLRDLADQRDHRLKSPQIGVIRFKNSGL